jgi:hypothetical protein
MMAIMIHPHARVRMEERGVTQNEVEIAMRKGEKFPANGKFFRIKQVEVYGVDEERDFIVITVVVKYF